MSDRISKIKKAMESEEGFFDILRQECQSPEFQEEKQRVEEGPHPPNPMLHAYVLDELDDEKESLIRRHMAFCGICFEEIRRLEAVEAEFEAEVAEWLDEPVQMVAAAPAAGFGRYLSNLKEIFNARRIFLVPGFAAAVVCLLLIAWWASDPDVPGLGKQINGSFQTAMSDVPGQFAMHDRLRLTIESEDNVLGFSPTGDSSDVSKAFAAGFLAGRRELTGTGNPELAEALAPESAASWEETGFAGYYGLGKWTVLMMTVCGDDAPEMSADFWEDQRDILGQIEKEWEEMPGADDFKGRVQAVFTKILNLMEKEAVPGIRDRYEIVEELHRIVRRIL